MRDNLTRPVNAHDVDDVPRNQIILHEEKKYYPTAQEVYGEDVETMVQEEDAQPLSEPIVQPIKVRKWAIEEKGLPETRYDKGWVLLRPFCMHNSHRLHARFLVDMMNFPEMIRNVAVLGHLHHGKTALLDMLVFETHSMVWDADRPVSFSLPSSFASPD